MKHRKSRRVRTRQPDRPFAHFETFLRDTREFYAGRIPTEEWCRAYLFYLKGHRDGFLDAQ